MASNAVKAPRGSPFITEAGNLTPAWHHYLANIEQFDAVEQLVSKGGLALTSADLQRLIEINATLTELEAIITAFEVSLRQRNWQFFYDNNGHMDTGIGNAHCIVAHALGTKRVIARNQDEFSGVFNTFTAALNSENQIDFTHGVGGYTGDHHAKSFILALYD